MVGTTQKVGMQVEVTGDSRDLKSEMRKALTAVDRFESKSTRSLRRFDLTFKNSVGGATKLLGGFGIAAGLSLAGVTSAIKSTISEASKISDVADAVGVSTEALQQFRFAAEQSGIGTEAADKSLQQFSRRLGEARQGTGTLLKITEAYGIALDDVNGNQRATLDILGDVADVIEKAGSQQERANIAYQAFGRAGVDVVNVLRDGKDAFLDLAGSAEVLEDSLVRRAKAIDDEWTTLVNKFSTEFKTQILGFAKVLDDTFGFSRQGQIENLKRQIEELEKVISIARTPTIWDKVLGPPEDDPKQLARLQELRNELAKLEAQEDKLANRRTTDAGTGGAVTSAEEEDDNNKKLAEKVNKLEAILERQREERALVEFIGVEREIENKLLQARKAAQEDYNNGLRETVDLTEAETAAIRNSITEIRAIEEERKANEERRKAATKAQEEAEKALYEAQKTAAEEQARQLEEIREQGLRVAEDIGNSLFDAFRRGIEGGEGLKGVLKEVEGALIGIIERQLVQPEVNALSGLLFGGIGGQIAGAQGGGSLFAGLFHAGAKNVGSPHARRSVSASAFKSAPRFHNGLRPDEFPAILQKGETVIPKTGGGGGGSTTVYVQGVTDMESMRKNRATIARETSRAVRMGAMRN